LNQQQYEITLNEQIIRIIENDNALGVVDALIKGSRIGAYWLIVNT